METWLAANWLALWGAVTGTLGLVVGGWAAWGNWIIARKATERPKPVVTAFPTAFVNHPGWHQIELTIWNYAEAPVRIEDVTIAGPRDARLLNRAQAESPDAFGHPQPDPDRMLREPPQRTVKVGYQIAPATGGGNPYRFATIVYAHSPSPDRPKFRLRCSFSWSDRLMRRFEITIDMKQPT